MGLVRNEAAGKSVGKNNCGGGIEVRLLPTGLELELEFEWFSVWGETNNP